jgi:hypothetical protein
VTCDGLSLCNPAYWIGGLIIFGAGLWTGRAVALRTIPPSSWRTIAGMALICAGVLALPAAQHLAISLAVGFGVFAFAQYALAGPARTDELCSHRSRSGTSTPT